MASTYTTACGSFAPYCKTCLGWWTEENKRILRKRNSTVGGGVGAYPSFVLGTQRTVLGVVSEPLQESTPVLLYVRADNGARRYRRTKWSIRREHRSDIWNLDERRYLPRIFLLFAELFFLYGDKPIDTTEDLMACLASCPATATIAHSFVWSPFSFSSTVSKIQKGFWVYRHSWIPLFSSVYSDVWLPTEVQWPKQSAGICFSSLE